MENLVAGFDKMVNDGFPGYGELSLSVHEGMHTFLGSLLPGSVVCRSVMDLLDSHGSG